MAKAQTTAALEARCLKAAEQMGFELVDVCLDYDFMEVSSPGLDRPLKKDRDFERNLGTEVEVRLFKPMDGAKVLTGTLAGLEDGVILLDTAEGRREVPRKAAALVKPVVDMEGSEDVDLSGED